MKFIKGISTLILMLFFILSTSFITTVASPEFIDQIGTLGVNGISNGQFENPRGLLVVGDNLWVADSGNHRIQIFDRDGSYIDQFGNMGYLENQFWEPAGMDSNGTHIGIVENKNERVQIFNKFNNSVAIIGQGGNLNGEFNYPTDIAFADDVFFVSDSSNSRIQAFNQSGNTYLFKFGEGSGYENVVYPTGMDIYENKLYIVDSDNATIKIFNLKGDLISYYGGYGYGLDSLINPVDVKIVNGYSIVTDAGTNSVKIFDEKGNYVDQISDGIGDYPEMLEVTDTKLYVSNLFDYTVNLYQIIENPTNVLATKGFGSVSIRWEENGGSGVIKAEKFRIFRNNGSGFEFLVDTTNHNYLDRSVKVNVTYSYQVQSVSPIGKSEMVTSNKVFLDSSYPGIPLDNDGNITINTTITEGSSLPLSWNIILLPIFAIPVIRIIKRRKR